MTRPKEMAPHKITFLLKNGQRAAIKEPYYISEDWITNTLDYLLKGSAVIVKSKDADIVVMPGEVASIIIHHTPYEER